MQKVARKIRVLVVDDAVVVRKLVTDVLAADPEIEVAGIAANGRIALQKIAQLAPDIVTLDIEMPEMDGLETIREIRKTWPALPVIMFSTLTERGATATLEALSRGASDYVTKPANVGSVLAAQRQVRDDLIPKLKAFCAGVLQTPRDAIVRVAPVVRNTPLFVPPVETGAPRLPVGLLVIGSSTGGPNALAAIIPQLVAEFPVPVVIVQHMPPVFTRLLAERLMATSKLKVYEATDGARPVPGTVFIAQGNHHLVFKREDNVVSLQLTQDAPEHSCRPAVDVTFRSAAALFGSRVLGVMLTGMGQDGVIGSAAIREAGGQVIVQDEATSVVWGMPGNVARAGLANAIVPLNGIVSEIAQRVDAGRAMKGSRSATAVRPASVSAS